MLHRLRRMPIGAEPNRRRRTFYSGPRRESASRVPSCRGGCAGATCLTRSALVAAFQELVALRLADGRVEATLRRRRPGIRRQRPGLRAARFAPDPREAQMVLHLPHAEHAVRDVLDYPLLDPRRDPARKRHHTAVHLDLDVLLVDRGERNAVPHVVEDPLARPSIPRRPIATQCRCRALVLVLQRRRHLLPASADGAADLRRSSAHPAAEPRPPLLERAAEPAGARADARAQPAEDAAAPGVFARAYLVTRLVAVTLVPKPLVRVPPIRIAKALVRAEVVAVSVFAPLLPVIDRHRCASSVPRTQTQTRPPPAAVSPSGDLVRCVAGKVRGRRRTARESRARSSPPGPRQGSRSSVCKGTEPCSSPPPEGEIVRVPCHWSRRRRAL